MAQGVVTPGFITPYTGGTVLPGHMNVPFQREKNLLFQTSTGIWQKGLTATAGYAYEVGRVLGIVTGTGFMAPRKYTQLTAAVAVGATVMSVSDTAAFKVGDNIVVGTEAATTVSAVDSANKKITLTAAIAVAGGQAINAAVRGNDGSQTGAFLCNSSFDGTSTGMNTSGLVDILLGGFVYVSAIPDYFPNVATDLNGRVINAFDAAGILRF